MKAAAKKVFIGIIGGIVLLAGIAMIVLPGPAVLVIPAGLAILATEFKWARDLKDRFKHRIEAWREKHRQKKQKRASSTFGTRRIP